MHHAQGFQYPALDLAFRTGLHPKAESHVVAHGHMREQRVILKHGIDLTALRRDVVHPLPADGYVTLIRGLEARKDSQNGRLAATGRSKEGQKLAVADTQINALKRASVLERFVHTPQFDDIVLSGHSFRLPPYPCMEGRASPERDRHTSAIHGSARPSVQILAKKPSAACPGGPSGLPKAVSGPSLSRILYMRRVKGSRKAPSMILQLTFCF